MTQIAAVLPFASSSDESVDIALRAALETLGAPWSVWTRLRFRALRAEARALVAREHVAVDVAVETVVGPYRNRLTLVAYVLLFGSVAVNALVVTKLSSYPPLAAFAATFGGTLAAALGYQVLARLQAWAKQLSSNGGAVKTEAIPLNTPCLDIWRRSQQMKNDLQRDGRNIRKDAWLQLHPRFEKALALASDQDACEAVADALVDHRQSYGEVRIDPFLAREFHRNLKERFANESCYHAIVAAAKATEPLHGLPHADVQKLIDDILRPDTWRHMATWRAGA